MQNEGIKSIEVTQEACDDFYYQLDQLHENTVWRDSCRSWYKKNNKVWVWLGAVRTPFPPNFNNPPFPSKLLF